MPTAERSLAGHVALVTGASRGIGRAIARRLAAHGAQVVVTASARSHEGLLETCARIEQAGGRAASLAADLAIEEARANLIADATAFFGPIDILVNNAAAISAYTPPSTIDVEARRLMFEVNFHAPVDLIQQALPAMQARRWGRIVNLTTEMTRQPPAPYPGPAKLVHALVTYGASKAAFDRYSIGLAAELQGSGICVNALAPFRIALSENAEAVARQMVVQYPDWVEPLEMMAEAAYLMVAGEYSGLNVKSREWLKSLNAPLHALDGKTVIGDATTLARLD